MSRWQLLLVVPLLLVAACGSDTGTEEPEPSKATQQTAAPLTDIPDPTLTAKPTGAAQTLTGTVAGGVEDGCLTLTVTQGQPGPWLLVGSTGDLAAGDQVTVRGRPAPDLATRCQQGTPFVVEAVEPGA